MTSSNKLMKSNWILKGKPVPLQARSGPVGSRKLRFPDYVTTAQDGGKIVSLTHRLFLPPGNTPGTHFCYRMSRHQGHSAIGRIISMKDSNDTIWNRTRDLQNCSAAPEPLCYRGQPPEFLWLQLYKFQATYSTMQHFILRSVLSRRITVGRTSLDEWSARRRGFYLTTHNTHNRQTSIGLLWKGDQPIAETSTWQHTTLTTDKHLCPRWDSNPRSRKACGRRLTP